MTCLRTSAAALVALVALTGCFDIASEVPAISDADRLGEIALTPGLYCLAELETDEAGALADVGLDGCDTIGVEGGAIVIPQEDGAEPLTLIAARLERGALLLQSYDAAEARYRLMIAMVREDGFAIVRPPLQTRAIEAAARASGVELDLHQGDEILDEPPPLHIVAGEPGAVLTFLRHASGLWFDFALRDPEINLELLNESAFYVRLDADPDVTPPDQAALRAQVDELRNAIGFAMTLE